MRRAWRFGVIALLSAVVIYVGWQARLTLQVLDSVERERDTWQQPDAVVDALALHAGQTAIDFGCGAGYFALKLARVVGSGGTVLATDVRFESLAFLWLRARLGGRDNLHVIHGEWLDPHLPQTFADAALVSNTYHELQAPDVIVQSLRQHLKSGGRLVVLDRASRTGDSAGREESLVHHELRPEVVERDLRRAGFIIVSRDDRFIDQPRDDDVWWLLIAEKP